MDLQAYITRNIANYNSCSSSKPLRKGNLSIAPGIIAIQPDTKSRNATKDSLGRAVTKYIRHPAFLTTTQSPHSEPAKIHVPSKKRKTLNYTCDSTMPLDLTQKILRLPTLDSGSKDICTGGIIKSIKARSPQAKNRMNKEVVQNRLQNSAKETKLSGNRTKGFPCNVKKQYIGDVVEKSERPIIDTMTFTFSKLSGACSACKKCMVPTFELEAEEINLPINDLEEHEQQQQQQDSHESSAVVCTFADTVKK